MEVCVERKTVGLVWCGSARTIFDCESRVVGLRASSDRYWCCVIIWDPICRLAWGVAGRCG